MRLSEFKGEEAIDVLADIIEPISRIIADKEIQVLAKDNAPVLKYVKPILKNNKKDIIEILARLDCKPVDEYSKALNLLTLPKQIIDLISDPEVQSLFTSQEQIQVTSNASSTPATENTEASEK